jgi:ABC-type phosphate transport system substrate-binding protein
MKANYLVPAITVALLLATHASAEELAVVVNAKVAVDKLTAEQVSQLFLGKVGALPNGTAVFPVDQSESAPARELFYTKVLKRSLTDAKTYWSKMVFTGKGQPPKEVGNSADVKKLIASNPNLIGYIDKSAVDDSVKVVYTQ